MTIASAWTLELGLETRTYSVNRKCGAQSNACRDEICICCHPLPRVLGYDNRLFTPDIAVKIDRFAVRLWLRVDDNCHSGKTS